MHVENRKPQTCEEYLSYVEYLRGIDTDEPVEVDELGNTAPAREFAGLVLQAVCERASRVAWQPSARARLQEAKIL